MAQVEVAARRDHSMALAAAVVRRRSLVPVSRLLPELVVVAAPIRGVQVGPDPTVGRVTDRPAGLLLVAWPGHWVPVAVPVVPVAEPDQVEQQRVAAPVVPVAVQVQLAVAVAVADMAVAVAVAVNPPAVPVAVAVAVAAGSARTPSERRHTQLPQVVLEKEARVVVSGTTDPLLSRHSNGRRSHPRRLATVR